MWRVHLGNHLVSVYSIHSTKVESLVFSLFGRLFLFTFEHNNPLRCYQFIIIRGLSWCSHTICFFFGITLDCNPKIILCNDVVLYHVLVVYMHFRTGDSSPVWFHGRFWLPEICTMFVLTSFFISSPSILNWLKRAVYESWKGADRLGWLFRFVLLRRTGKAIPISNTFGVSCAMYWQTQEPRK